MLHDLLEIQLNIFGIMDKFKMKDTHAMPKWLLLQCFLVSTLAFSIPDIRNASSLSLQIATNATSLTAPVAPPGFEAIVTLNRNELLSLNFTRTNFVSFLYDHYQQKPDHIIQGELWYRPYQPSFYVQAEPLARNRLKLNHVVLGLNQAAMAMVLPGNGFFEAKVSLMLHRRRIGTIDIYMGRSENSAISEPPTAVNVTEVVSPTYHTTNEIARGLVVDRTWPDMAVEWLYDESESKAISENDIFTAIMSALTTASQFSPNDYCQSLHATSSESESGVTVDLVVSSPAEQSKMRYRDLKTMLYLMYIKFIVSSKAYREFSFTLQHDVHEIWGEGSISIRGGGRTSAVMARS